MGSTIERLVAHRCKELVVELDTIKLAEQEACQKYETVRQHRIHLERRLNALTAAIETLEIKEAPDA